MKILVIGTPKSGAKQLVNGISKQGYELFDEPFHTNDWRAFTPNYMNLSEYTKNSKIVVSITTLQQPDEVKSYGLFISQFASQFDKIILIDKINVRDLQRIKFGFPQRKHKKCLQKISEIMNTEITTYEKLFDVDTISQFETINKLELDLDSFELQSFLDPNNESYIL